MTVVVSICVSYSCAFDCLRAQLSSEEIADTDFNFCSSRHSWSSKAFLDTKMESKKVGCFARQPTRMICSEPSVYVCGARLGICFDRSRWLRRQLKHRCNLTLT